MSQKNCKYLKWGAFLKKSREVKFRSAREFCQKRDLKISYPQYSRYESGEQLPNLEQAMILMELLEISIRPGLLEWSLAQLPEGSPASKRLQNFSEGVSVVENGEVRIAERIRLDDVIVFNNSHLEIFSSNPVYRDLFTYINSYAPESILAEELSLVTGLESAELLSMLTRLEEIGVVARDSKNSEAYRATKQIFYFPDDETYFDLRNQNVSRNVDSVLSRLKFSDIAKRQAFRSVVTRELNAEQIEWVIRAVERLAHFVVHLPESKNSEKIFSLNLVFGSRFERPSRVDLDPKELSSYTS